MSNSFFLFNFSPKRKAKVRDAWSKEQANEWYKQWPWFCGCNFIPSNAINQLEMWQAETFDPQTIDRELALAQSLGMNITRVYLHHLVWQANPEAFKQRMEQYLSMAYKRGIYTLFVIFDDCWNVTYKSGKQPNPKPGVHNSGWVRDPGDLIYTETKLVIKLEEYFKDILTSFANDKRIVLWDIYNEPGNSKYGNRSMSLLKKAFQWGREVNPSQPLTSGIWSPALEDLNKYQLANSDVITYHDYNNPVMHGQAIEALKGYGKPLLCTEYMARPYNSRFDNILPLLKKENIAAINWGLVAGKTNTIYAWDVPIADGSEPSVWFHDIFRSDGTPYIDDEVKTIREMTRKEVLQVK